MNDIASVSAARGFVAPRVFRFRLGELTVTNILDAAIVRDSVAQKFAAGQPESDLARVAAEHRIDANRLLHPFVVTLVESGGRRILFDSGCGELRRGVGVGDFSKLLPDGDLVAMLAGVGVAPSNIDTVVLTHGHPDHVGGLMTGGRPTFPDADYVFGAAEFDFWNKGVGVREWRRPHRELFVKLAVPLAERARFVKPGDDIAPGIRAVDAAGHSPGQLGFLLEGGGQGLMLWADVAIQFAISLARPDWQVDVDDDKERAVATRRRILDQVTTDRLWAIGAHMPFPGLGYVERAGDGYRWVPHSYQLLM